MAISYTTSITQERASHDLGSSTTWWLKMIAFLLAFNTCLLTVAAFSYFRRNSHISSKVSAAKKWSQSKIFNFFAFMLLKLGSWVIRIGREISRNGTSWARKPPTTLKEFTCFQRLPLELREQIWEYASHHARVVLVDYREKYPGICLWNMANNFPPAILKVNSEARRVGLKYYILVDITTGRKTYVNFDVDIIYLATLPEISLSDYHGNDWTSGWVKEDLLKKLRRLAVPIDTMVPGFFSKGMCYDLMDLLGPDGKYLEELILVDEDRAGDSSTERFMIPLKRNDWFLHTDQIERYKEDREVGEFLETTKYDLQNLEPGIWGDHEKEWMKSFSPEFKMMQLRYQYQNGIENPTPSRPQPNGYENEASNPNSTKPIHLGELQKINGLWGITKC